VFPVLRTEKIAQLSVGQAPAALRHFDPAHVALGQTRQIDPLDPGGMSAFAPKAAVVPEIDLSPGFVGSRQEWLRDRHAPC
jgi:hypothetical protein